MTELELFYLMQDLLKDEERSADAFHTRDAEMKEVLEIRKHQKENPLLKFSIFDPLRNESARKLRLQRVRKPPRSPRKVVSLNFPPLSFLLSPTVRANENT